MYNACQYFTIVVIQSAGNAKSCSQRRCQQTASGSGANQSKWIEFDLNSPGIGPAVNHNINLIIFHSGVQVFLHNRTESVNLINEQNIKWFKIGQKTRKITGFVKYRTTAHSQVY